MGCFCSAFHVVIDILEECGRLIFMTNLNKTLKKKKPPCRFLQLTVYSSIRIFYFSLGKNEIFHMSNLVNLRSARFHIIIRSEALMTLNHISE